ncbi:hypothetical protein OMW55_05015 [Sphingomonas sp. BN140010]|uniref:Uncharacterized protein n=1 Tax=Sphingomonas arvum TaxID=2992113 RepID=A0ABT3JDK7_9SPHN|nr:hypothetical protein [Sphingomonas sp. BN140010]MCW3797168.1 hypothetical protein [Sphingomonas sp. BN140010]
MATTLPVRRTLHPVPAVLLACSLSLFLGAWLSDWTYAKSFYVQWINFAAWLNAGGMVFLGFATLWALIDIFRADVPRDRGSALFVLLLLVAFILGLIAAFVHTKDANAPMPEALVLDVIVFLLVLAATWLGFSTIRSGAAR